LSQDCRRALKGLSESIPGCGYSDRGDSLGFHHEDLSVLVENRQVSIIGAEDEATARKLMGWLQERLDVATGS
jgi:hypothetical protein